MLNHKQEQTRSKQLLADKKSKIKDRLIRKRKTKDPCDACALHKNLCICGLIPHLDLRTRLSLIAHAKELKRTTNTGQLALKALKNSALFVRGQLGDSSVGLELSCLLDKNYQPLLFYPSDDAVELSAEYLSQYKRPIHLIVPDGNWRQASKVHIRHQELSQVPRVKLKIDSIPSNNAFGGQKQFMRLETKPEGMATLEAIAHAMKIIEGDRVFDQLIAVYNGKLQATLIGRKGGMPVVNRLPGKV